MSITWRPQVQRLGLFTQTLLMLVGLVVGSLVLNAVLFSVVPPPAPPFYELEHLISALKAGADRPPPRGLLLSVEPNAPPVRRPVDPLELEVRRMVTSALADGLDVAPERLRVVILRRPRPLAPPGLAMRSRAPLVWPAASRPPPVPGPFRIAVRQPDGTWLTLRTRAALSPAQRLGIFSLGACSLIALAMAWLFARGLAAPIRRFADAADRVTETASAEGLSLSGPTEFQRAGDAVQRMHERLRRQVQGRSVLLGAVAHDLKTLLERMRFLLETPAGDVKTRLNTAIDEMDAMVSAALTLARDDTHKGPRVPMDLLALLESLAEDATDEGHDVRLQRREPVLIHADPHALRRLFGNLISNSIKFSGGGLISMWRGEGDCLIEVLTVGVELPPEDLEQAFEPFYRGEASRRQNVGTGLGLAIVRSVARAHGGEAILLNRPEGLVCQVRLPLAPDAASAAPRTDQVQVNSVPQS